MASLKKLFDYQKYEHNDKLDDLIHQTESRYSNSNIIQLGDDDLEMVAAGTKIAIEYRYCSKCGKNTDHRAAAGRLFCTVCNTQNF